MGKIKDKPKLIRRAQWHRRQDHFIHMKYVIDNGVAEGFKGCAIGCLSQPHIKQERKLWFDRLLAAPNVDKLLDVEPETLVDLMVEEFNLDPALIRLAEGIFESIPDHPRDSNFVVDFAKAIPENTAITKAMIRKFYKDHTVLFVDDDEALYFYDFVSSSSIDWGDQDFWPKGRGEEAATALLDWLKSYG